MGGKSTTLTQQEPRLSNIRIQTSSQGNVIPKGWGRYRVGCNLAWYDNFQVIEHRSVEEQGGKGGGGGVKQVTITYTYTAAIIVSLGHGPINGVVSAWKGKERLAGEDVPEVRKTLRHTVTVPDLGGTFNWVLGNNNAGGSTYAVTVPLPGGATFAGPVAVQRVDNTHTVGGRYRGQVLAKQGTEYTVNPTTGQYTFKRDARAGQYQITYQVIETAAHWRSALGQLNLSLMPGLMDQPVWPWLASEYPEFALSYPGMAIAYSPAYALTNAAELYNHNFEVSTGTELGLLPGRAEPVLDADPSIIVSDVVLDEAWGASWTTANMRGLDRYSDYCIAMGFWLSPVLEEQSTAAELLEGLLKLTNTDVVWDGDELIFEPLGDQDVSANGATYVADTTPLVDLTMDHFITADGEAPIKIRRHYGQDGSDELSTGDDVGYNVWTLEIENRANGYAVEPVSYEDTAHILLHGRRQKPTIKARHVKDPQIGQAMATLLCQRELSKRNVYEFRLPWNFGFLRPLHLVTLTDTTFLLDRKPVRILTKDEEDEQFTFTAEDCDIGQASAPAYGAQAGAGYTQDYGVSPGQVAAPVIFEPPVELAPETGLAVWLAVTGTTPLWGGAEVWCSMDGGVTYKRIADARGGARYGVLASTLAAAPGGTLDLQLAGRGGQVMSATAEDAAALASLMYVRPPAGAPEYLAYETATLAAANRYTMTGLVRGAYDSLTDAKPAGSVAVRVDDLVVRGEPLQLSMIGQVLKFKFLSYNVFGGGLQSLEDAVEYSYTITGDMARLPPRNVSSFTLTTQGDGTRVFSWAWGAVPKPADLKGYMVRYRQGSGWDWDDMLPFVTDDGFFTASPIETNQLLAGDYTFAIKTVDQLGVLADTARYIEGTLPDPRLGNALVYRQLHVEGWPGTLTDAVREMAGGQLILRARDQAVWDGGSSDLPADWASWTRWVWDPVTSMVYEPPAEDFGAVVSVLPALNAQGTGVQLFEESHCDDGVTWSAWAPVAGVVQARYVRTRVTVSVAVGDPTGPGITPVLMLETMSLAYIGRVDKEYGNDIDPAALIAPHRIGVGHFRLPTGKAWAYYSRIGLVMQNVGPGWTWELLDKDLIDGPAVKTYDASLALADPPLIDFDIEGIVQS